jgi:hypothetical protein
MKKNRFAKKLLISSVLAGIALLFAPIANAQYFQSLPEDNQRIIVKASGYDSVIVYRSTFFDIPKTNDTLPLVYHEPMPDSIMPRSAIVIGTITLQFEDGEDLVPALEKFARKAGADWIVSFQEPRAVLTKDRWKVYRSTALLLHVLDPNFIDESKISYSYYEQNKISNYVALSDWFNTYGKHMGFNGDNNKDDDNLDESK